MFKISFKFYEVKIVFTTENYLYQSKVFGIDIFQFITIFHYILIKTLIKIDNLLNFLDLCSIICIIVYINYRYVV